jgi:hypothetical protein
MFALSVKKKGEEFFFFFFEVITFSLMNYQKIRDAPMNCQLDQKIAFNYHSYMFCPNLLPPATTPYSFFFFFFFFFLFFVCFFFLKKKILVLIFLLINLNQINKPFF